MSSSKSRVRVSCGGIAPALLGGAMSIRGTASASCALLVLAATLHAATPASGQDSAGVLEFRYTPVARAQVAIWVEDEAGRYLATVALTEAVAYRGIGNRPGASQMNSGYRWPYGRREGVLPIWAHRRADAPGARLFPRVVFQQRREGYGSRMTWDQSVDPYFCLSFEPAASERDALDAVSCASVFSSDKGRYMTAADREMDYAEPWQEDGAASMRALPLESVYPPRMDVTRCRGGTECYDHADVDRFADDARAVMPEIDAVTQATAPGDTPQKLLFSVPADWPAGAYVAWIEVHVEGDYNARWNDAAYPTPLLPEIEWDSYAVEYGYAYRGQPSIVYRVPFTLGAEPGSSFATELPVGRSSWRYFDRDYGRLEPITFDSDDPTAIANEDGSGADRLRRDAEGRRFTVVVGPNEDDPAPDTGGGADAGSAPGHGGTDPGSAGGSGVAEPTPRAAPGVVRDLSLQLHPDERRSHTWVVMRFAAPSSPRPIHGYDVRVATGPIVDESSFLREGRPARTATDDPAGPAALMLPTAASAGEPIEAVIGDLLAETHYFVAVRATDDLNRHGPIRVAEITTTSRTFATVTPCFVATAAYGSPLAGQVHALRRLRDRYLLSIAPGRALVSAYHSAGPPAARWLERHAQWRALARWLLQPLVSLAQQLDAER